MKSRLIGNYEIRASPDGLVNCLRVVAVEYVKSRLDLYVIIIVIQVSDIIIIFKASTLSSK